MKKLALIAVLLILLVPFFGCKKEENSNSSLDKGNAALKAENYKEAITLFTEVIEKDAQSFPAFLGRAQAHNKIGEFVLGFQDSTRALEIKAGDFDASVQKAISFEGRGKLREAGIVYNVLVKKYPKNGESYFLRGNFYAKQWKFTRAIEDYNRSLKYNPKNSEAYLNRGILYQKKGQFKLAISDYTKAIQMRSIQDTESSPASYAYFNRGGAYYKIGNITAAVKDWQKAKEMAPKSVEGNMADICLKQYAQRD